MTHRSIDFPLAWMWLVDELIPEWVKATYSPRDSWKGKLFSKQDAHFFFRGIEELSDMFTDERPTQLPAYFNHPKFRSAYLLYFLPLQAAKFLAVFNLHPAALRAALKLSRKSGVFRVGDLGAGPGTASIALLLWLLQESHDTNEDLPKIELHWLDTHKGIMKDGVTLVEKLSTQFPRLRERVSVQMHEMPWWEAPAKLPGEMSLLLLGNVLNESKLPHSFLQRKDGENLWKKLMDRQTGAGILFLEPALRRSSQLLSVLRDELIEAEVVPAQPSSVWGPCLHAGKCPLSEGRDWCHFSVPAAIPGKWFAEFSKGLGSERHWLKFSYLWLASENAPAPVPAPHLRRIVSDPLKRDMTEDLLLTCEPEVVGRIKVPAVRRIRRGDVISTQVFDRQER